MTTINEQRELVSILQRGSWYQVSFLETNAQGGRGLRTLTVQGIKNTRKHCQYYSIVHTKGTPYVVSRGIDLNLFLEKG